MLATQNALKQDGLHSIDILTTKCQYVLILKLKWKQKPIKDLLAMLRIEAGVCCVVCGKWVAAHKNTSLDWLLLPAPDLHISQFCLTNIIQFPVISYFSVSVGLSVGS